MANRIDRNRQFQRDLFSGPFPGHAVCFDRPPLVDSPGDVTTSERPVSDWVPSLVASYQAWVEQTEALGDDAVPMVPMTTHTGIFAEAFGCRVVPFQDSNAAALPFLHTAAEADALPTPHWSDGRGLARWWQLAELLRAELGPDVPLSGPDIQSPFDIAALIWNKEELFLAMVDSPEAVLGLVAKTYAVLTGFLDDFRAAFPQHNVIHCPSAAFAPPELGCSLSEDEAGSLSPAMFERFCLPSLVAMSERYGGMFMHCCAKADAHYPLFARVPRLRGLNRVFQYPPGPGPALEQFAAETVHMVAWRDEAGIAELLNLARPDTRFLFDLGWQPLDSAAACLDRLRARFAEGPRDVVVK